MPPKNNSNTIFLTCLAAVSALYIYDVQANNGKHIDTLGLPNWNPPPAIIQPSSVYEQGKQKIEEIKSSSTEWISDKTNKGSDLVHNVGSSVGSLFSSSQEAAAKSYSNAKVSLEDAQNNYNQYKKSWLSWGEDKNKEAREKAKAQLDAAQKNFDSSKDSLAKWGKDAVNDADNHLSAILKKYQKKTGKWVDDVSKDITQKYDELRAEAQKPLTEREFVKASSQSLRGWGDSASEFAKDEYDALFDKAGKLQLSSQESIEKVQKYYDDMSKDAEKKYKETQASWLKWKDGASKEVQDQAKAQYEQVMARKKEADSQLAKAMEQAKANMKDGTQNVIGKAQEQLDKASSYVAKK